MWCKKCGSYLTQEMIDVNMCWECGQIIDMKQFEGTDQQNGGPVKKEEQVNDAADERNLEISEYWPQKENDDISPGRKRNHAVFYLVYLVVFVAAGLINTRTQESRALREAKKILSMNAYSRQGCYNQLIMEGFGEEEAADAIRHLDVDWKKQAYRSAKEPPEGVLMEMTYEDLTRRLKKEGFTDEEIAYAAEHYRMPAVIDGRLVAVGNPDWRDLD